MSPNLRWFQRLTALVRPNRLQRDLDDELLFHIEARTRDNIARGMPADDARLAALRLFGNRTLMAERMRDADVNLWIDAGLRNLRYAARVLRAEPRIHRRRRALDGARHRRQHGRVQPAQRGGPEDAAGEESRGTGHPRGPRQRARRRENRCTIGTRDFRNFQTNAGQYLELFATSGTSAVTTLQDQAEQVSVGLVTGNYYSVLGVQPFHGRLLDRQDDSDKEPRLVAVLDYDFWRRRFGGDPTITGRQIVLNGVPFAIVGVTPRGFVGTSLHPPASVTVPVQTEGRLSDGESFRTIGGRLRPGVSRQQAGSCSRQCRVVRRALANCGSTHG